MGGEKPEWAPITFLMLGSPPRGRGKVIGTVADAVSMGITPAWAGKRTRSYPCRPWSWDYPRVGGEKLRAGITARPKGGSPPRRRGKANWHCVRRPALRITPAQAGKRTRSWRAYGCPWDHPRVGGEKKGVRHWWALPRGSPPRGRGKVSRGRGKLKNVGITPAWAGKSRHSRIFAVITRDHPRMGGEKADAAADRAMTVGSPPHGRGKACTARRRAALHGITPARAGKSQTCPARRSRCRDHPRVSGEKLVKVCIKIHKNGSPPRERGKGVNVNCSADDIWITPA